MTISIETCVSFLGLAVSFAALAVSYGANRTAEQAVFTTRQVLAFEGCVKLHEAQLGFRSATKRLTDTADMDRSQSQSEVRKAGEAMLAQLLLLQPIVSTMRLQDESGEAISKRLDSAIKETQGIVFEVPPLDPKYAKVRDTYLNLNWVPALCDNILRSQ